MEFKKKPAQVVNITSVTVNSPLLTKIKYFSFKSKKIYGAVLGMLDCAKWEAKYLMHLWLSLLRNLTLSFLEISFPL